MSDIIVTLAEYLSGLIEALDLYDVTLVGFSMGGGETASMSAMPMRSIP